MIQAVNVLSIGQRFLADGLLHSIVFGSSGLLAEQRLGRAAVELMLGRSPAREIC